MKIETDKIGIIIPTHNRKKYLEIVLDCIKNQQLTGNLIETIVVVDGSTDGTVELLEYYYSDVYIVKGNGKWWFTRSLNEGCKKAKKLGCNYILTLNDDCHFDNSLIQILLTAQKSIITPAIVGSITLIKSIKYRVTFSGTKRFIKWRAKLIPYLDNRIEYDIEELNGIYPTFSLMTRGLLFPIEIGEKVGFFDEKNFPQYGSDDDFILRLLKHGFSAYVSWDAKIYDEPLLSSVGSSITHPTFKQFIFSFFNKYSLNSLSKTYRFKKIHGRVILLPFSMIYYILGAFYAHIWKY
ncbi:MAG: glycosyltransferase family 2 protein, partial [Actinomycetia bacterium]|nr:glycosyltransferase family 2 protein [Actinomycetes bacterium]